VAARLLGRLMRHPRTEEAFIGGLLHDVGKLVLTQKLQAEYQTIREAASKDGAWCRHEKAQLGFTHVDVAVAMLEQWNFPRELVEAIAMHHAEPEAAPDRPPTLAQLIWLANHIANSLAPAGKVAEVQPWDQLFKRANVDWDAGKIADFFSTFEEQLAQERWLFAENS